MREYKAITKTPMIPTRSNGMGKLMVEIIEYGNNLKFIIIEQNKNFYT